jgi:O-antigen ligase
MNRLTIRDQKSTAWAFTAILSYLTVIAVLLSPQFYYTGKIGPSEPFHGERVIISALIILIAVACSDRVRIPVNRVSFGLILITTSVTISLLSNIVLFGLNPSYYDVLFILLWVTYVLIFIVIGGNISIKTAQSCLILSLVITILIAVFALFQSAGNQFALETLRPIYTERSIRHVRLSPTATTSNPNSLGKLVLIPLFTFFALSYRSIIKKREHKDIMYSILFAFLALLFFSIIVISDARSALIGAIVGVCVIITSLKFSQVGNHKYEQWITRGIILVVILILYISIFVLEVGRIGNLQNILQDNSLQTRFYRWKQILPLILDHPLIGHGPDDRFISQVSFEYIDSGVLAWWYFFGIVGVLSYLYFVIGVIRVGFNGLRNKHMFQDRPIIWSSSVAVLGWFSGTLVVWIFAGVPNSQRVFTFALIIVAFIFNSTTETTS